MKEQKRIPTSKVGRASEFVKTGMKVGGNYVKFYTKKTIGQDVSRDDLDIDNAEEIFKSLNLLKGSALKAAQMMSMDQGFLPKAYADKFQKALTGAQPLSYPLVAKTFRRYFGKGPTQVFETFSRSAVHAASIGQVHKASIGDKQFAVKVQYPGVAESVGSDLRMAKPIAARLVKIQESELDYFMEEIEAKLYEETDYKLELNNAIQLSKACQDLEDITFPSYYPEFSNDRILTMDWMEGLPLIEWMKKDHPQEVRNRVGQAIWDFYAYQLHKLKKSHADPHPGNFILLEDGRVGVVDFGCVKEVPEDFYVAYKKMMIEDLSEEDLIAVYHDLSMLHPEDSEEERAIFISLYHRLISLLSEPYKKDSYHFGESELFGNIHVIMDEVLRSKQIRKANAARGSKHSIFINRIFFGLYSILTELRAEVRTDSFME